MPMPLMKVAPASTLPRVAPTRRHATSTSRRKKTMELATSRAAQVASCLGHAIMMRVPLLTMVHVSSLMPLVFAHLFVSLMQMVMAFVMPMRCLDARTSMRPTSVHWPQMTMATVYLKAASAQISPVTMHWPTRAMVSAPTPLSVQTLQETAWCSWTTCWISLLRTAQAVQNGGWSGFRTVVLSRPWALRTWMSIQQVARTQQLRTMTQLQHSTWVLVSGWVAPTVRH